MEEESLKKLYLDYSDSIYFFLLRRSGSQELAFDLMQDTFIRAGTYYKEVKNPKAWLFMIARNLLIDYMKRQSNKINEAYDDTLYLLNLIAPENVENDITWKILKNTILKKLAEENPLFCDLFLLRLDHNLSHKEIATTTGLSFRTVRRYFEKIRNVIYRNFKDDLSIKEPSFNEEKS